MKKAFKKVLSVMLVVIIMLTAAPLSGFVGLKLPEWLDFTVNANAKTISEYQVGDIVKFGSYPQSKVTDSSLISKLNSQSKTWTYYDYYIGTGDGVPGEAKPSDYMKYTDIKYNGEKYRGVQFTTYRSWCTEYLWNYTCQYENGYHPNAIYWFRYEPLEWRVLDADEGYLMCENIIDNQAYYDVIYYDSVTKEYYKDSSFTSYANDFESSTIRDWLNDDFYQIAFSNEEQVYIQTVNNDSVSLLSYDDAKNSEYGFSSDPQEEDLSRIAQGTDYAKCQGLSYQQDASDSFYGDCCGNSEWWLSTPGGNSMADIGRLDGGVNSASRVNVLHGVRPTLKLNPQSEIPNPENPEPEIGEDYSNVTVKYHNGDGEQIGNITLNFKQSWFNSDSENYNHDLATFCAQFVTLGYDIKSLKSHLKTIGFKNDKEGDIVWETDAKEDQVDNFIARREITVNGETYTLIFVGCIGTNTVQWYSNFKPETGETHASFNDAKNYVYKNIENYIEENNIDTTKTKILLCGHSRGAATANLLAAKLIDEQKFATKENIYTYTFATPNPTSSTKTTDSKYARIFNIVNPEDFVTKVLPAQWGYSRYGTTYVLPSKTNTSPSSYKTLKSNMQSYFGEITGEIYTPFKNGEEETYKIVNKFTSTVKGIDDFYYKGMRGSIVDNDMKPYEFFQSCICPLVGADMESEDFIKGLASFVVALIDPTTCKTYKEFAKYFFVNAVLDRVNNMTPDLLKVVLPIIEPALTIVSVTLSTSEGYFEDSHRAETYCAYMMSMTGNQIQYPRKRYENTVNCPVDIEVYDKVTGELVGRIVDNVVDEEIAAKDNSIVMSVEGDSKSFWLPADNEYDIKLIGNDDGTMDYTVAEIDGDSVETARVNFVDVEINDDKSMSGDFSGEDFVIEDYTLVTEDDEIIESDDLITPDNKDEYEFDVEISTVGVGFATGDGTYTKGDYVTVVASTDEANEFLGWYEDDELVSTEAEYGFVVQNDVELIAEFTENEDNPCADGHNFYYGFCTVCGESDIIESAHPYDDDTDETYVIYKKDASYIYIRFSRDTFVEENYDFIEIYDMNDNLVGRYTGDELASEQVTVDGDTAIIRLVSDSSNTGYGFTINEMGYMIIPSTDAGYEFYIQEPSITDIRNRDRLYLHANFDGERPDGSYIKWRFNNGNFSMLTSGNDDTYACVTAENKGYTTFVAILYDANGNELACDSVELYSKSGFFDKIGGFFRSLFGTTKTYYN